MNGLVMPHRSPEPRAPWWVAPVCFVVVGGFWALLGVCLAAGVRA